MPSARRLAAHVARPLSEFRAADGGWTLLLVSAGWFLTLGVRIVYPALLPRITAEFGISYALTGTLVGVLWAAYALLQFPGGIAADRLGERFVLSLSVALALGAVVGVVLAPSFGPFVLATAVLGVATGLYGTTRVTVLTATYPGRSATAISISQAAGNVGNVVLPVGAGAASAYAGWRWGFGYMLPLFVLTAVGLRLAVPARVSEADSTESIGRTARRGLAACRDPRVLAVTGALFLTMFAYQSLTGFLPTYLVEVKGLGTGTAATLYGFFFATSILLQFVSGLVSDEYGSLTALAAFAAASVPGFVLLTVAEGVVALAGVVAVLASLLGGFPPAHDYIVRALPSEVQGSGYGLLRTFYIGFGAAGPPVVGILADAGLFDDAFFLLGAVAAGVSVIAAVVLPALE